MAVTHNMKNFRKHVSDEVGGDWLSMSSYVLVDQHVSYMAGTGFWKSRGAMIRTLRSEEVSLARVWSTQRYSRSQAMLR